MQSMITISVVILSHQVKKDGTYPIKFRLTYNRKSVYIRTPYFADSSQLNKKNEIIDTYLEIQITEERIKAQRYLSANYLELSKLSIKNIANVLSNYLYGDSKENSIKFIPFAHKVIKIKEKASYYNGKNYNTCLNKVRKFVGHDEFAINDINLKFVQEFDNWLQESGITARGRKNYLSNLRCIINMAIEEYNDEERNLIQITVNPFRKFKLPKQEEYRDVALTADQIRAIRDVQLKRETDIFARDIFMLSFYLVGMNTVDLYHLKKIEKNRIVYNRTKTSSRRDDGALVSIKIEPEAETIINRYIDGQKYDTIFPFKRRYSSSAGFNAQINKFLKRVGAEVNIPDLVFYSARHTWATLFVNECGGNESDAAFCLNHVTEHKVTSRYIKKDFTRIDVANRRLLDYIK